MNIIKSFQQFTVYTHNSPEPWTPIYHQWILNWGKETKGYGLPDKVFRMISCICDYFIRDLYIFMLYIQPTCGKTELKLRLNIYPKWNFHNLLNISDRGVLGMGLPKRVNDRRFDIEYIYICYGWEKLIPTFGAYACK